MDTITYTIDTEKRIVSIVEDGQLKAQNNYLLWSPDEGLLLTNENTDTDWIAENLKWSTDADGDFIFPYEDSFEVRL